MSVVTLIGGRSTGRRIDVGDNDSIYVPYRGVDGRFLAELYSPRDWLVGDSPIKLWCNDGMRDDDVLRHLVESLPHRVEGPQWEALDDAMHAMSRLKSSERAKVFDACRYMSEPVPYEGPMCFTITKGE